MCVCVFVFLDARFNSSFDKETGYRTKSILCTPVTDPSGDIVAVIQCINKLPEGNKEQDAKEKIID